MWAEPAARHAAAVTLYRRRLPKEACIEGTPLRVMRGLEGRLVKTAYQRYARLLNQPGWRRRTDSDDPVNQALNLGNSVLYGCALSVCSALAISPVGDHRKSRSVISESRGPEVALLPGGRG